MKKNLDMVAWNNLTATLSSSSTSCWQEKAGLRRELGIAKNVCAGIDDPVVRKSLIRWNENTCNHLEGSFKALLKLRAKIARLSGFKNFLELEAAGYAVAGKYRHRKLLDVQSPMSVMGELQAQLAPTIESFIENLRELKLVDMRSRSKAHSRPSAADVGLNWGDVEYYGLKAEQSKFPGSHKIHRSIGEYFPMELTTRKLLDMCGQVFGLSFSRLSGDESGNFKKRYIQTKKWPKSDSKDLLVFKVHDTSTGSHGALLGVLLLDLVDKKSKPQGAQCGTFGQCEVKNLGSQKWSPAIYIRAVFPPARKDAPVLVSSYNVITLAHELGHAIQEFTRGGLDSMAWDSVEIASHLVERLVSEPAVQRELSSHYVYEQQAYLDAWSTSGRSLPPKQAPLDLLEKGVDMYLHDQILPFLRTLWFTKLDFILHSFTEEMLDAVDLGVECQKALSEWTGIC
ncbi:hypothetical protein ONS96_009918 [Cadophora gregata f. sp. sojae]|nr:hypothetical protein ONS96_009918 [Cadophora gregata f. sp. sojae]